jgi:predicted porin
MNNTIKLAVASALLAAASSASAAGGIVAGDWTLDVGGVVNAYYTNTKATGTATGLAGANDTGTKNASNITTGLLPNYLAVSGKTRQNDLDVSFTISINPGASTTKAGIQSANQENRQAFLTFGDASWGSIKLGKDLGIYASDAILNDMTLLGVGSAAGMLAGNTTTLGRIGTGFMYADWKAQAAYSSPNFNGFNFTVGATQAFESASNSGRGGSEPAFEAKASYAFAVDAVNGKVWASGISQRLSGIGATSAVTVDGGYRTTYNTTDGSAIRTANSAAIAANPGTSTTAEAFDIGANINAAGFGLTGYYGEGKGTGTTVQFNGGLDAAGNKRTSKDWYTQATYTLPGVGTKLGVSYGESQLNGTAADSFSKKTNEMWVMGAYHPITKHLNLVAEYSEVTGKSVNEAVTASATPYNAATGAFTGNQAAGVAKGETKTISLGAILFF